MRTFQSFVPPRRWGLLVACVALGAAAPGLAQFQGMVSADDLTWFNERGEVVAMPGQIVDLPKARYVKQMRSVGPDQCIPPNPEWTLVAESESHCWYEIPQEPRDGESAWSTPDGVAACQDQGGGNLYCEVRKVIGPLQMAIDVWRIARTAFPGRPVPPGCVQQEDLIFCPGGSRSIGSPGPGPLAGGAQTNSSGGGASSGGAGGGASNGGRGGDRGDGDGGSSAGNPPASNEEDCLPRVDPRVVARLQNERNGLLRDLAGGGYMADLTLQTWGKLLAARLHHLTEPNEGLAARTVAGAQRAWDYAPQKVAEAARAVTRYLASSPADNHRMLYEEAQAAIQKAEDGLRAAMRNPQVVLAQAADTMLIGKVAMTVTPQICRAWPPAKTAQIEQGILEARKAEEGLAEVSEAARRFRAGPQVGAACGLVELEGGVDCFPRAVHLDQRPGWRRGDPVQSLDRIPGSITETTVEGSLVQEVLKEQYGSNALDPETGFQFGLLAHRLGVPVGVSSQQALEQALRRGWARLPRDQKRPVGGLMFMETGDAAGVRSRHVINVRFLGATFEYWDDQQTMDGSLWFADVLSAAFFRTF
jgi:hypothetical protein